jgi:hypothetical protein
VFKNRNENLKSTKEYNEVKEEFSWKSEQFLWSVQSEEDEYVR